MEMKTRVVSENSRFGKFLLHIVARNKEITQARKEGKSLDEILDIYEKYEKLGRTLHVDSDAAILVGVQNG